METIYGKPASEIYSGKNSLKPVNFYFDAPRAGMVRLAGDFNHWNAVPMHRRPDGWWFAQVLLGHGHHQYRFVVDGTLQLDPQAVGVGRNERNEQVSIVAVS